MLNGLGGLPLATAFTSNQGDRLPGHALCVAFLSSLPKALSTAAADMFPLHGLMVDQWVLNMCLWVSVFILKVTFINM